MRTFKSITASKRTNRSLVMPWSPWSLLEAVDGTSNHQDTQDRFAGRTPQGGLS